MAANREPKVMKTEQSTAARDGSPHLVALSLLKFRRYDIGIEFTSPILGGLPKDPKMVERWLDSLKEKEKARTTALARSRDLPATLQEYAEEIDLDSVEEGSWKTFRSDDVGVFVAGHQIIGMLEDAVAAMKTKQAYGFKRALRDATIISDSEILNSRERIYFKPIASEPQGSVEWGASVTTASGPRQIIQRCDYMDVGTQLAFNLWILEVGDVSPDSLLEAFGVGSLVRMGSARVRGHGRFKIIKWAVDEPAKLDEDTITALANNKILAGVAG